MGGTWNKQREEITEPLIILLLLIIKPDPDPLVERGLILYTVHGGQNWEKQLPKVFERETFEEELENPPPSLFGVVFKDKKCGWACGIDGTIIYTADGGNTWDQVPSGTDLTLYTLFLKGEKGWVVGDMGAYLMSGDGGMTLAGSG